MVAALNILIIDDEPLPRAGMRRRLEDCGVQVVGEAESAEAGWRLIETLREQARIDVVFLDIEMEYRNAGLDLGRRIAKLERPPRLVFVTGHPEYVNHIWPCHPDYVLLKPVDDSDLNAALDRVRAELARSTPPPLPAPQSRLILFKHDRVNRFGEKETTLSPVKSEDIVYIQTNSVRLADGSVLEGIKEKLKDLEDMLIHCGFFRVHNSYLINLRRVYYLKPGPGEESHRAVMRGCERDLPIARDRWTDLLEALKRIV